MMTIAEHYFSAMRARDLTTILSLFAEDAEIHLPDGRIVQGRDAIKAFYLQLLATPSPSPLAIHRVTGERGIATETEITLPNGDKRYTGNFFHLDARNLITRFSIYARSV